VIHATDVWRVPLGLDAKHNAGVRVRLDDREVRLPEHEEPAGSLNGAREVNRLTLSVGQVNRRAG
jgi:hypothetical protein